MTRPLAPWTTTVAGSPTAKIEAAVAELRAKGTTLYRLSVGEPDFPTPEHAKAAGIDAIHEDFSRYTETAGILPLRQAIAARIRANLGILYEPAEIVVTAGAKQALFNAVSAIAGPGDEVLVPVPYWVSFPWQVRLAGATPIFVPAAEADGYRPTARALREAITARTRAMIVNTPNNPSGAIYGRDDLEAIAALAREHDLWVVSDEVYSAFALTADHVSIASLAGMRERTALVDATSKTYGMTGWRLGYLAAPAALAEAAVRLQSHTTTRAASIAQRAALAALTGPQDDVARHRAEFAGRANWMYGALASVRGLRPFPPQGGFFVWTDMSWWCGRELAGRTISSSDDLAATLLDEVRVVVTPGTGFGSASHLRISFSAGRAELTEAVSRIARLLGPA